MKKAIINANLYLPDGIYKNKVLMMEDGIITAVTNVPDLGAEILDAAGSNLAAGLIDIQLNGGEEYYFSEHINTTTLDDMQQACLNEGTTHFMPCLISSPKENILEAIELVKNYVQQNKTVLGIHLEGPFLNPNKRGAHNLAYVRKPTNEELEEIIKYGKNVIKIITIAPDQFSKEQLSILIESGITISMGHTDLTYEEAQKYFDEGIHLVTHLFNAMSQFGHRTPGMVGAVLDNEKVYAPIILDGAHTHYAAARIAFRIKKEKLFLITDSSFLGRKKLAFHLRHLSVGLITNDDFESNLMDDVTNGWLPEQYYRAKEAKFDDLIIQPMLELCWGLYDDTRQHKLRGSDKLSDESLKIIARCILFLHSDQEYKWPYFDTWAILSRQKKATS